MKYLAFTTISFFFILSSLNVNAEMTDDNEVSQLISQFYSYANENKFLQAAKLFHYPPSYSVQELHKDIDGVSGLLEALKETFGEASKLGVSKTGEKIISLQVGGGDIPYWQQHPQYLTLIYSAHFSKYGAGFITFTICNISNKFEIREVKYGLAATRSNSTQLLQDAVKHMQLMDEKKKSDGLIL